MRKVQKNHFIILLNSLGLGLICGLLGTAFLYQFIRFDLPCPLCLLQRAGLILAGFGFLFNIRLGYKNSHYAWVIVGSLVTAVVAVRQILLHIGPGDPGYSTTLFGLHFYTWCLIASMGIILTLCGIFVISDLTDSWELPSFFVRKKNIVNSLISITFCILIVLTLITTVLECGFGPCPDDPKQYAVLSNFFR